MIDYHFIVLTVLFSFYLLSCFTIQSMIVRQSLNKCLQWDCLAYLQVMLHVFALQFNLASTLIARFEKENSH